MRSKIRLIKASPKEVIGSGFAGYLKARYQDLVDNLGKPHDRTEDGKWQSMDGKVKVEWAFKIKGKKKPTIITIYDYKDNRPVEEITDWHVGSKGDTAPIEKFFKQFPGKPMEIVKKLTN